MATDKRQFVDLASVTIAPDVLELIPELVVREHCVLALAVEKAPVHVALSDPTDRERIDQLELILNRPLVPVFAPLEAILQAIDRHYGSEKVYAKPIAEVELSAPAKDAQQGSRARRYLNMELLKALGYCFRRLQIWRRRTESETYGWYGDEVLSVVPFPLHLIDELADELGQKGVEKWQNGKVPAWNYGVYQVDLGDDTVLVRYEVTVLPDGVSIGLEFATATAVQVQSAMAISEEIDIEVLNQLLDFPDSFEDGITVSKYEFEALDFSGYEVQGTVEALSDAKAVEQIRQMEYFLTRIKRCRRPAR